MAVKRKASATLEALLVIPIMYTFLLFMIWVLDLFRIHSEIGGIVTESGNNLVACSYAYEKFSDGESDGDITSLALSAGWSETILRAKVESAECAEDLSELVCSLGTHLNNGEISISVLYRVKSPAEIPFIKGVLLKNSFYSAAYTGYQSKGESEIVYIARFGKVYHTDRNCRTIKTTVVSTAFDDLPDKRNRSGCRYYPCKKCAHGENPGIVFITPYGNRYHFDRYCYEINTVIYEIPLDEVKDRRKCFVCP